MAPMTKLVEAKPSSFKEEVEKFLWVDAMVEKYEFIVKNNVWEIVPRPIDKAVVGSIWIFKVNHVAYEIIEK